MNTCDKVQSKLREKFSPLYLAVIDETHLHTAHVQNQDSVGGHYVVTIVSDLFRGKTLLERHRAIYDVLRTEITGEVHALKIKAFSSDEWKNAERF